jgi:hypothetical protein
VTTGWISFADKDPNRIRLPVSIDGRQVVGVLDSGASSSWIDSGLAASLGHKLAGRFPTLGENGVGPDAARVQGVNLAIGPLAFRNLTVGVADFAPGGKRGEFWPLIIGGDIFADAVADFDFANRRVAFWDPAAYRPPSNAIVVRLERDGFWRLAPLSLDGGPPVLFVMDTGFFPNLRLSPGATDKPKMLDGHAQTTVALGAIGGVASGTLASFCP